MSFYHLPHPWNPGYAIPKYVLAEPPERGTFTTQWLPRGTISQIVPDYLAKPGRKILGRTDADLGSLGGTSLDCSTLSRPTLKDHSLAGSSLGAEVYMLEPLGQGGNDPVGAYGKKAASWIMTTIGRVPAPQRKVALRALLDKVDPGLWAKVEARGSELEKAGVPAKQALEQALASEMAAGIANEVIAAGHRALRGDRAPVRAEGQLGLGAYPAYRRQMQRTAQREVISELGAWYNPVDAVKNAARAVAGAAGAIKKGVVNAAGEVWDGTKWVGGKVASGAKAAGGWVADGVKALGGLACSMLNSGAGQIAATVGGGPAGAAGAAAAASACARPSSGGGGVVAPSGGLPSWALPVGIGAGVLVLAVALRKK